MTDILLAQTLGAVRLLTLNRPERLNALNPELLTALNEAFDAASADTSVRAVLLTGAGRGFCAGADLMQDLGPNGDRDLGRSIEAYYNPLVRKMRALNKPIVSAVNGVAAGAGMNLALAGDIIIAARSASFTQAFIRIGLMPDAGGTYFLPRLIGDARARAMAMLGETMTAAQAEAAGLVWKLFDDEVFPTEALTVATNLAAKPAQALAAMKQAFNASAHNGLDAQLELECDLQRDLGNTHDFEEGVRAFLEKRPGVFSRLGGS
ncbi:MAG TPA: enoyl-CoA hydratase-related protein [Acidocella sp.]|nr:enoyl-CoA hydratase-related protein [Acidocella sp.]